jgi:hypothetical protein
MSDLARIEIERDIAKAAARRAAEEGLTVTAYVSPLLRRSFERAPGDESILIYDHVGDGGEVHIERESDEDATIGAPRCMDASSIATIDASSGRLVLCNFPFRQSRGPRPSPHIVLCPAAGRQSDTRFAIVFSKVTRQP